MDQEQVFDCGTPFKYSQRDTQFEIKRLRQYEHMLAPYLEKAGLSHRQFILMTAMHYMWPSTVANLAEIAEVDLEAALDDIHALEREGFVTLEAPPWQFETPEVETTERYEAAYDMLAPALWWLDRYTRDVSADPTHPWQGPPPRV